MLLDSSNLDFYSRVGGGKKITGLISTRRSFEGHLSDCKKKGEFLKLDKKMACYSICLI